MSTCERKERGNCGRHMRVLPVVTGTKMRMNSIFWTVVVVDALLFIALLASMLMQTSGRTDGGREMGIAFFVVLPLLILGIAVLLYVFAGSIFWKAIALLIVAGPGLFIAGGQIRGRMIDYRVQQNALGRGYFNDSAMKDMGAAVVQGDTGTLLRIGPTVDVNAVAEGDRTLLRLAVEQIYEAKSPKQIQAELAVVRTLLALGAKPGSGMDTALKLSDPTVLRELLAAGADPNQSVPAGHPIVFRWLSVMPLANLQLLIDRGLNVDATEYETPLALEAALKRRWDLVALLADHGANIRAPRADGRTIAEEVNNRMAEAQAEGTAPSAPLLQVQEALRAIPSPAG